MMNVPPPLGRWPLLLCLLLFPRVGLAIQDTPLTAHSPSIARDSATELVLSPASGLPGTAAPAPLQLMDESPPEPMKKGLPPVWRILAETGTGLLASTWGLLLGAATPQVIGRCEQSETVARFIRRNCGLPSLFGAVMGASIGFPLGVWWGGEALGGES